MAEMAISWSCESKIDAIYSITHEWMAILVIICPGVLVRGLELICHDFWIETEHLVPGFLVLLQSLSECLPSLNTIRY